MSWKFLFIPLLVVFLSLPVSSYGDEDIEKSRKRLEQLEGKIQKTIQNINRKKSESNQLSEDLYQLDSEIRQVQKQERATQKKLSNLSETIEKKSIELQSLSHLSKDTEQKIKKRLVVLYKTGQTGLLRSLLSEAESPKEILEKYTYLSKMVQYDKQLLSRYRSEIQSYENTLQELEKFRDDQKAISEKHAKQKNILKKAQQTKNKLLSLAKKDKEVLETLLEDLRLKAARLDDLVKKLERQQGQSYTVENDGLLALKGRLVWPVSGKLRVGFGTSRQNELGTLIESHGFDIETEVDSPVNAVASGKVIFANTLRGYGKLIIIDHGRKYYTLYAHVSRFTKKIGDPVVPAEVIAYSGYDGRDALYFEIRHGGEPLDPGEWLKPR